MNIQKSQLFGRWVYAGRMPALPGKAGYAGIMQSGKSALYHMTMIDSDELIPYHQKLVDRIHQIGGKIVLQIAHWLDDTVGEFI